MHVVDHRSGDETESASRSILAEAARLTHGKVEPLEAMAPERLHALIIPGGGGAVKNLMTGYLRPGQRREALPAVRAVLVHCLDAGKPVGLMSLANFLLAGLVETPLLPEQAGTPTTPLLVDEGRRLVYAPAFLTAGSLAEVAAAVHGLVELVLHYADLARRPEATGK
jgi:enhancing lycopene biosynthesis protein 2